MDWHSRQYGTPAHRQHARCQKALPGRHLQTPFALCFRQAGNVKIHLTHLTLQPSRPLGELRGLEVHLDYLKITPLKVISLFASRKLHESFPRAPPSVVTGRALLGRRGAGTCRCGGGGCPEAGAAASAEQPGRAPRGTGAALPVNKGVIVSTIVLDLEHTYPRYVPLKIEFQQRSRGGCFRNHHLLILADFRIPVATAHIGA